MKAAIISQGSESSGMLCRAMQKYFSAVDMLNLQDIEVNLSNKLETLYEGKPLSEYHCIYAKGSYKYAHLLGAITSSLSRTAYMPIVESAFVMAHDKIYTQIGIQQNNIPMPTTYLAATIEGARKILRKINYPLVMKFPKGAQGKGVMFADSFGSASSILDALATLKQPFLMQEYVETGGIDTRLIVVGKNVIAAMRRKAAFGEQRANLHAGATGDSFMPGEFIKKIAVEAASSIGAEVCAIDILEGAKGPVVIEINISPGLQGITKVTGIDVADKIASYLYEQTSKRFESKKSGEMKEFIKDVSYEEGHEIIVPAEFRGERLILPQVASKASRLKDTDELSIVAKKGEIIVKKY